MSFQLIELVPYCYLIIHIKVLEVIRSYSYFTDGHEKYLKRDIIGLID